MERIGLIAGSGRFPFLVARAARARGFQVIAIGHLGDTDPALATEVDRMHWVHLGQLGREIGLLERDGVCRATMAGGIGKLKGILRARLDWVAIRAAATLRDLNDDRLLRTIAGQFESRGIRIEAPTTLTPELLVPAGALTRREPTPRERDDMAFGLEVALAIGRADVGQTVVVEGKKVLAVEASEGTDDTIRRGGGYGSGGAVVVKRTKPGQDLRFDLPAVGEGTIRVMAAARCRVLAVESGRTVLLDGDAAIRAADAEGIAVVGVPA